jgi:uncharacterized protein HemY
MAIALRGLGNVAYEQGHYGSARGYYEQGLAVSRELGNKQGMASSLSNLGDLALTQQDYATARVYVEESLALYRELQDTRGIAIALNNLGNVAYAQEDYSRARALLRESLIMGQDLGDRLGIAACLAALAAAALAETQRRQEQHPQIAPARHEQPALSYSDYDPVNTDTARWATRLLGAAAELLEVTGGGLGPGERRIYEQAGASAERLLDPQDCVAARAAGRAMSLEQIIAYAGAGPGR